VVIAANALVAVKTVVAEEILARLVMAKIKIKPGMKEIVAKKCDEKFCKYL